MFVTLLFIGIFSIGFMALSVFKKHGLINLAIIFLMLGGIWTIENSEYPAQVWFQLAFISVIIYEIYEMSKMRIK